MIFTPLNPDEPSPDVDEVAALWSECAPELPLEPATLRQRLGGTVGTFLLAREENELRGFIWLQPPTQPEAPGFLSALAVHPEARRKGLATQLLQRAARDLADCTRLKVGGSATHLVPGVPLGSDVTLRHFLRAQGATFGSVVHDLYLDLRPPLPKISLSADLTVETDSPDGVLRFLERVFPGRWRESAEWYLERGNIVLSLEKDGKVLGFCCVFQPGATFAGPSLFWRRALMGSVAGLGPIGIDPDLRGQGQGLAFFSAAAGWLRTRGAEHLLVDWTDLTGFYGRAGAHVWRSYQYATFSLDGLTEIP